MFNLIVRYIEWENGSATMPLERMLSYTGDAIAQRFGGNAGPDLPELMKLPCLFMNEGSEYQACFVGTITRARIVAEEVRFDFTIDREIPSIINNMIFERRQKFDIEESEFSTNHWAVKDIDLYKTLFKTVRQRRQLPTAFKIAEHEKVDDRLLSAMMPFSAEMVAVHDAIRLAAHNSGMRCKRADNIWEHSELIQDVVDLIDAARVVVCDCTGRNANVFYEAGIAHTLGRDVILITQSGDDIPFDLKHHRYISYDANGEGLTKLVVELQKRIQTIRNRA